MQKEELSGNKLLDKQAIDIVKDLQRLQGLDDDYENDSGSGPDRIERRKTIHHLAKHAAKKKQIGTLDVAFKKRFFKLNENGEGPGTPILSKRGILNQATMKALEVRRKTVMAERKESKMKTLGATNNFAQINGLQPRNHRNSTTVSVSDVFSQSGHVNNAYVADEIAERNSLQMQSRWNNNNNRM